MCVCVCWFIGYVPLYVCISFIWILHDRSACIDLSVFFLFFFSDLFIHGILSLFCVTLYCCHPCFHQEFHERQAVINDLKICFVVWLSVMFPHNSLYECQLCVCVCTFVYVHKCLCRYVCMKTITKLQLLRTLVEKESVLTCEKQVERAFQTWP